MLPLLTTILVLFITFLLWVFIFKDKKRKKFEVPGMSPSDPMLGNLPDMFSAGSLPSFLAQLHAKYGPIASFWFRDVLTVSLGDKKLLKYSERIFDRHPAMFEFALPLISTKSMQFCNGEEGRDRYKMFSQAFNHESCTRLVGGLGEVAMEVIGRWKGGSVIKLHEQMMELAVEMITKTQFGGYFKDPENVHNFKTLYQDIFTDFDDALLGSWSFGRGDEREKQFEINIENFKKTVSNIVKFHKDRKNDGEYDVAPFLDIVVDNLDEEEDIISQAITFIVGGFHTTGMYLTWLFYYAAQYPEVQTKMREEVFEKLGDKGVSDMKDTDGLTYVKQVMDECLRIAKIAVFTERKAEKDFEIDGYVVKEGTQIVNAICLTMDDERLFPDPETFNPDRFKPDAKGKGLAFSPFGYGVRKCPGYRFSQIEVLITVVEVLSKFILEVENKEDIVKPIYGFITKPEKEIEIRISNVSV